MADASSENIRKRHIERQKRRMRQMKRRRIITVSLLISIVFLIIIFFTPLFNIRKIEVVGNSKIETAQIEENLTLALGKNIFRYRSGSAVKKIKSIPYVSAAYVKKHVFSCKLTVTVEECTPAAYLAVGEKSVVLDANLKVLEVLDEVKYNIPEILDVVAVDIKPGEKITLQDNDTANAVSTCIPVLVNEGIIDGVKHISFKDLKNVTFNYQNRLDVICGTTDDFEKKIKFFYQAINSKSLTENSRGTIDLSVPGQAVYDP